MNELTTEFIKFIVAYDNYHLSMSELVYSVISMYCYTKDSEYDNAMKEYDKIINIIYENELEGTSDLFDPINTIYYNHIKPYVIKENIHPT